MIEHSNWPDFKRSLVAILRGIQPEEVGDALDVLIETGFEAIEIPLNSPDAFRSIEDAVLRAGDQALIGAGTVLTTDDVERLHDVGGRLVVSPNTDSSVIQKSRGYGMVSMPGVFTPSEAFLALSAGASALKFFPANILGAQGIKAIMAVLPKDCVVGAVGGVGDAEFADYAAIGVRTFGLGSSLYRPGDDASTLKTNAERAIEAYDRAFGF